MIEHKNIYFNMWCMVQWHVFYPTEDYTGAQQFIRMIAYSRHEKVLHTIATAKTFSHQMWSALHLMYTLILPMLIWLYSSQYKPPKVYNRFPSGAFILIMPCPSRC
jgi:cytochrome c oxidase subunit IV